MRFALRFAVAILGIGMTVSTVMAQSSYNNLPISNSGLTQGRVNRLPLVSTPSTRFQQTAANSAPQTIGSGVQANSPTGLPLGQSPRGWMGRTQLPTNPYPAIQSPVRGYSMPQYSWPRQYPVPNAHAVPTYSQPPGGPSRSYSGLPNGYVGNSFSSTPSGRLFEISASDPTPSNSPAYEMRWQTDPIHVVPQDNSTGQDGAVYGGPANQHWTTEIETSPEGFVPTTTQSYITPASRWFAGVYALAMTRDRENNVWLSYDTNDIRSRVLNTYDASHSYSAGYEIRLGRFFKNGATAIEFVYWEMYPGSEEANAFGANVVLDLDTILHFDGISYDPGLGPQLISTLYFQADRHRLRRNYNLRNVELNVFESNYTQICGCDNVKLSWAVGIRYIEFDDNFLYSTDPIDVLFTGAPEELHYGVDVTNELLGFQAGGRADVCFWPGFTSYMDTKVGFYVNHSSQHSQIFGSTGVATVSDVVSPYFGTQIDIASEKTAATFVAEFRAGIDYQLSPGWSATIGYRALGISGVALSTNQIPVDFISAIDSLRSVDTNGSLIAHGAFGGLEFNY